MFTDILQFWERCTYFIVGIYCITRMIVAVYLEGQEYKDTFYHLLPGWSWIGRQMDGSDYEWWLWKKEIKQLLVMNTIHVLLSQACFYFKSGEKVHMCILLVFDATAVLAYRGIRIVFLLTSTALTMYAVSFVGSTALVWLVGLSFLSLLNITVFLNYLMKWFHVNSEESYLLCMMFPFLVSHLLSFTVEKIKYRRTKALQINIDLQTFETEQYGRTGGLRLSDSIAETRSKRGPDTCNEEHKSCEQSSTYNDINMQTVDRDPSLIDLFFYIFYVPIFFNGPILIYKDFHTQIKASFTSNNFKPDVCDIVKKLIRIAFWAFFIDFQFHFLYYRSFTLYPHLLSKLSMWALHGVGYCQGQFFMVKYLVIYGFSIQIARFDGITPIAVPRCISWVYSYTDMWKHFDVGLYIFIKTYIYIPLGGSRAGLLRQFFVSSLVFTFIYVWHGAILEIFIWCFGNFLTGLLELVAIQIEQTPVGIKLTSFLGPAMCLRIKALLIFPIYLSSCLQIFYFFFHKEAGWIFVSRMIKKASWTTILAECVFFTACIHNALYLTERYKQKLKERTDRAKKEK